uniref:Serine/threonine-protein phosphatase 2A activator n=1 Tax=Latimeria chalumnae TaxID=7897 RepID=H3AZE6_LATCH
WATADAQSRSSPEDELVPFLSNHTFMVPKKEINMVSDMSKWKRSQVVEPDPVGIYIFEDPTLSSSVYIIQEKNFSLLHEVYNTYESVKRERGMCIEIVSCPHPRSLGKEQPIEKLMALLNTMDRWIDETPPVDQPSRFGNKAYRTWYARLEKEAENLVSSIIPENRSQAVPEVATYLKESVGNSTRIDYGTGHEAAFAAFLCCLCKIGILKLDDQLAIVFKVFNRYLEVMRKLQKVYRMEPAGSQGVWGLDDFQFLPFIWGSSQLIDHPQLEPRHFVDEKVVNENYQEYMFLECIKFITEMKTGPFAEHSNQLWNISAVPSWSKVNQGLIRMYRVECLEKFPVIQHFKFGSLLPIQPVQH